MRGERTLTTAGCADYGRDVIAWAAINGPYVEAFPPHFVIGNPMRADDSDTIVVEKIPDVG